jgi:hypothetical protein
MSRATRAFGLFVAGAFGGVAFIAACGSRTGLGVLEQVAAKRDATPDVRDAAPEAPPDVFDAPNMPEAQPLDVMPECSTPTYCDPSDPGYVKKCGIRTVKCTTLEQCVEPCGEAGAGDACAAQCVNPCVSSLGPNTSNGCEFYAVEMDTSPDTAGVCYAVFVVNQWQTGEAAKLQVELNGTTLPIEQFARIPSGTGTSITYAPFDSTAGLPQNQIAILFLSRDPNAATDPGAMPTDPRVLANCPPGVTPAVSADAALHGTGMGKAFQIKSNVPIVAYQMLPYGGGHARVTGATLLLPTNVWGTNYVAANAYKFPNLMGGSDANAGPTMAVVAVQDGTHVTINPVVDIQAGGGLSGTKRGVSVTYTLDQGQYVQFSQNQELTGSPIQSDAPVAVFGGSSLMDIPTGTLRADHGEQQLPPISALGSEYVAVRYRSREPGVEESVPWRIVGVVDGTTLSYDPAPPPGAPSTLKHGQVVEIDDPGPWVVSSQDSSHPFYFAQYMTGGSFLDTDVTSNVYGQGDPEYVNVIPPQQYLPSYVFFTDPTYPETNLVVVAEQDAATSLFPTVNLDCAGTLTGWQPVGKSGKYQFTRIDLSTGKYKGQNGCNNGVHTMKASFPGEGGSPPGSPLIGVTIWGWGSQATHTDNPASNANETDPNFSCWVSYAYPAGANISKLNSVVFPAK